MALLVCDGFDHYATADGLKKWNVFGTGVSINTTAGRRGGGALSLSDSTRFVAKTLPATYSTLYFGHAYNPGTISAGDLLHVMDGATVHCGLNVNVNGAIVAFRGTSATVLGTSANNTIVSGAYQYIECKVVIDDVAGEIVVRVNGVTVLSLTGVDTRNAGNPTANGYRVRGIGTTCLVDDHYVCDTSGSANNDFLGDVRIDTIYPNGAGTHQSWTPSTGTDHAALVDETAPNTTDYLTGGAAGSKETLTLQDLSVNGGILGVQVNAAVAKTDAGASTMKNLIRSGTTEANGAVFAPSTSYLYSSSIHETDPATGSAWLTAAINALEAGVEVVS